MVNSSLVNCCLTCDCHHSVGKEPRHVSSLSSGGSRQGGIGETPTEKLHRET